jgi:GAF domain-containing protein
VGLMRQRNDEALEAALQFLRQAGVDWPSHPTDADVRQEYERLWRTLGDRTIEELIELPSLETPEPQAIVDVMTGLFEVSALTGEKLLSFAACRLASFCIERGSCDGSALAYALLGQILGPYFGDYPTGFRFGQLALDLLDRRHQVRFRALIHIAIGLFVQPWERPLRSAIAPLRRGFEEAVEGGEMFYACAAANGLVNLRFQTGEPLPDVLREAERALALARKTRAGQLGDMTVGLERLIAALRGLTSAVSSFTGAEFDEQRFEAHLASKPGLEVAEGWYWIRKLQACLFGGQYVAAVAAGERAKPLLWTTGFALEAVEYHFSRALALAAQFDHASPEQQREHRKALGEHLAELERRATICPENFGNRAALVAAEAARLRGEFHEAANLYQQAIRSARENGFVQNEALAHETAARFYRANGLEMVADTCLREARDCYRRWGADGKVKLLEHLHPQLRERLATEPRATVAVAAEQLDLLAVIKASQTISGVMVQDELLRQLLRVVLEASGARRARLILAREHRVAAESLVEDPTPAPGGSAARFPESIIEYVRRTHARVLLEDAAADAGPFSGDEYLVRARPRSVLCLPIRRQSELVALLYLENDLIPGAFTPERLAALELLAGQAAISLENVLLLERGAGVR